MRSFRQTLLAAMCLFGTFAASGFCGNLPIPTNAESVVNIDVGRQLFVDNCLIATTDLKRVWHHPVKYAGNPVLKPETPWEINAGGNAATVPKGGGLWWDEKEKVFKLWYEGGWLHTVCYATSKDGLTWERPNVGLYPGTNILLPTNNPCWRPDSWSVVKNPDARHASERYLLSLHRPQTAPWTAADGVCAISPDGIAWTEISKLPPCGDRSSFFYDPFRERYVFSLRSCWCNPDETKGRRNRMCWETDDFLKGPGWSERGNELAAERWLQAEERDLIDPVVADPAIFPKTQLYNFDAVAYESVMLGLFEIHLGPENDLCEKRGLPKITDIKFGFSRDGKNFFREDYAAAIASERWDSGKWDTGYVQPVANGCVIVGDELWFYYGAFAGEPKRACTEGKQFDWTVDSGMYANGAMGVAKLRRDGFASLEGTGEIVTPPLEFAGEYLFVNVDAHAGAISAELIDRAGNPIPGFAAVDSRIERMDSTKLRLSWKGRDRLDTDKYLGHRLRFRLENAALYAFWVSLNPSGASNGYLAGGGPGYATLRDTPDFSRPVLPPTIASPDAEHSFTNRQHQGIPSIAASPAGTMWATWYGSPTPREDEHNYLILSRSVDGGETWGEFLTCDPDGDGPRRAFDPELWLAPDGKLRWFWTDRIGTVNAPPDADQLWMATLDPDTGRILEEPRVIATGVMMCKPIATKKGEWLLPVAHWGKNPSACVYVSTDGGRTFAFRGGARLPKERRLYDEHNLVECRDGSLVMYIRSRWSDDNCLWRSRSADGGRTWSEPELEPAANVSSRAFVCKLASGNWLMVKHHRWRKVASCRCCLNAMISKDEGKTWDGGLVLDSRVGSSYPDGQQLADGSIVVVSDFSRTGDREISFVRFREEDILTYAADPKRHLISGGKTEAKP